MFLIFLCDARERRARVRLVIDIFPWLVARASSLLAPFFLYSWAAKFERSRETNGDSGQSGEEIFFLLGGKVFNFMLIYGELNFFTPCKFEFFFLSLEIGFFCFNLKSFPGKKEIL